MQLQLKEKTPYCYTVNSENGSELTIVATPELSGDTRGFRPTELLPGALAACSVIDLRLILEKQRQQLDDLRVEIVSNRDTDKTPSVFTSIELKYYLYGKIDSDKAERALQLAVQKYCTVYQHLSATIKISYSFVINEE